MKAKKLPSGKWNCLAYSHTDENGKRKYKSFTAATKREAENLASAFQNNRSRMLDSSNWALGDAIDKYIELKRPILSPTTIHGYEIIRRNNFQSLMPVPLCNITQQLLESAVREEMEKKPRSSKNKTMSVKTLKNALGLVKAVCRRYNNGTEYFIDLPKKARRIRSLPLPEDICKAVKDTDVELPVLLAVWLSFTESEIRGLTKSKSVDGDYLTIREVVVRINGIDVCKEMAKEEMRNRRHRMPPYIKELISKVEGDVIVPMTPIMIYKHFRKYMSDAGLPEISFHDLRHINATLMATLRIPTNIAQERGGWKTDYVMKSVYTEVFTDSREQADNLIDEYFNSRLGIPPVS